MIANEILLASIIGPVYLLFGLSLLFHANSWQRLLKKYQEDHYLLFPLMLVMAVLGILIITAYNQWHLNLWLLITITGWALILKSAFYFLAPGSWIKAILSIKENKTLFYIGGIIVLIMGVFLTYAGYWPSAVG